jgi:hypothetical protein
MPENEYAVLAQVKKTCLKAGVEIKKSDLLRIGVSLIKNLKITELKDILGSLTPLKVGRPKVSTPAGLSCRCSDAASSAGRHCSPAALSSSRNGPCCGSPRQRPG